MMLKKSRIVLASAALFALASAPLHSVTEVGDSIVFLPSIVEGGHGFNGTAFVNAVNATYVVEAGSVAVDDQYLNSGAIKDTGAFDASSSVELNSGGGLNVITNATGFTMSNFSLGNDIKGVGNAFTDDAGAICIPYLKNSGGNLYSFNVLRTNDGSKYTLAVSISIPNRQAASGFGSVLDANGDLGFFVSTASNQNYLYKADGTLVETITTSAGSFKTQDIFYDESTGKLSFVGEISGIGALLTGPYSLPDLKITNVPEAESFAQTVGMMRLIVIENTQNQSMDITIPKPYIHAACTIESAPQIDGVWSELKRYKITCSNIILHQDKAGYTVANRFYRVKISFECAAIWQCLLTTRILMLCGYRYRYRFSLFDFRYHIGNSSIPIPIPIPILILIWIFDIAIDKNLKIYINISVAIIRTLYNL